MREGNRPSSRLGINSLSEHSEYGIVSDSVGASKAGAVWLHDENRMLIE
jgi:hypothetical protein